MTITVSIEELRAYEFELASWAVERSDVIVKNAIEVRNSLGSVYSIHPNTTKYLDEWEQRNPKPHLIPIV